MESSTTDELFQYGQTLNSDLYCQQLDRLKEKIVKETAHLGKTERNCVASDNARPNKLIVTRTKLREIEWKVLMHRSNNLVPAPSD